MSLVVHVSSEAIVCFVDNEVLMNCLNCIPVKKMKYSKRNNDMLLDMYYLKKKYCHISV